MAPDPQVAARLKQARILAGYRTAKEFSDKHDIPQSTYALHEKGGRGITRDVAINYAKVLKISVDWLLTGQQPDFTTSDPAQLQREELQRISVVGDVEAGVWREAIRWPQDAWKSAFVPMDDRYQGVRRFGLEVRGPSMNRVYPPGTTIVCVNLIDLGRGPRSGERVVCYLRSSEGLTEATVKEYVEEPDGSRWLWPRSNDPRFQQPVEVPYSSVDDENEDLRIVALVTGSYRPE